MWLIPFAETDPLQQPPYDHHEQLSGMWDQWLAEKGVVTGGRAELDEVIAGCYKSYAEAVAIVLGTPSIHGLQDAWECSQEFGRRFAVRCEYRVFPELVVRTPSACEAGDDIPEAEGGRPAGRAAAVGVVAPGDVLLLGGGGPDEVMVDDEHFPEFLEGRHFALRLARQLRSFYHQWHLCLHSPREDAVNTQYLAVCVRALGLAVDSFAGDPRASRDTRDLLNLAWETLSCGVCGCQGEDVLVGQRGVGGLRE